MKGRENPGCWFEIYVQDMTRARRFYETVLATTLQALDSPGVAMMAFLMAMNVPGTSGALVKMEGMPSAGNSTIVYFACDDCAVEADRVPDAGGTIVRPKFSIGDHGFVSIVTDTEGNMIGLHSATA